MAVKITRQPKNIVLLGAATSAAALRAGSERAPDALRAAGLADRLKGAGLQVLDHGNTSAYVSQPDEEHPRAKNVTAILKLLNDLRPRVEVAVKSGALPVILSGDCVSVLATIAGTRRYFRNVSLIYMDRDADLNVPATTSTGCIDGMVISQVIGRGAPELVRFWGEPPLVREPDVALFGFERLDPPEEQYLLASPLRRHPYLEVVSAGAAAAARLALERVHAAKHEFVLHFDVDLIYGEEFPWTNLPGTGGLSLSEVREALCVFASQPNLAAFEIAGYNPDLDPDGKGAQTLIELLATVLSKRLDALTGRTDQGAEAAGSASAAAVGASGSGSATVPQRDVSESLSSLAAGDFSGTSEPEPQDS
ncbi:MAG TPA: arginase family protein [Candidatus Acidoferrales bacterium]|nr:arginase family protein [Candidatus Acidoferrales bacterium]